MKQRKKNVSNCSFSIANHLQTSTCICYAHYGRVSPFGMVLLSGSYYFVPFFIFRFGQNQNISKIQIQKPCWPYPVPLSFYLILIEDPFSNRDLALTQPVLVWELCYVWDHLLLVYQNDLFVVPSSSSCPRWVDNPWCQCFQWRSQVLLSDLQFINSVVPLKVSKPVSLFLCAMIADLATMQQLRFN